MKLKNTRKGGIVLPQPGTKITTTLFLLFFAIVSYGQVTGIDTVNIADTANADEFPFINYEADTLINGRYLTPFFNKLLNLENCDSNQISIVHMGDSHIQADMLTREVRKNFQIQFGNAGRGLVFPLRVAGTNEPNDYRSSTNTGWTVAKINSLNRIPEPGISGISMSSDDNGAYFDITTYNHDDLDYAFDQITLIHVKDSLQFDCRITDSASRFSYLMSAWALEPGNCTTWVPFTHPSNFVRIQAEQTESIQTSVTFNGVILQNSTPGVLYHSIGINGARYDDYNKSKLFFSQLRILKPGLVIVSLGANEGADIKITEDEMIASVIALIRNIRLMNPEACILLTTPADDFYHKKYKNPYLKTVQQALVKSAGLEKVALWDLYNITGGFGSCTEWRKASLMQRDGVHFNKQGYVLQGSLLYKALMDSYLKYAAD